MNQFFSSLIEFSPEECEKTTYNEVVEGTRMKGYNFWLLGFAMIIACVGLNTDSISAVIGAMLISPLMGPILGLAFGLAIQDFKLKKIAISNWLWMTFICLISSTLFFLISPFDFNTVQLAAFQKATIFDILLAFFGGLAGFIGILRKDGMKVLSGVAVATACMPPLCTAGYGIANLDWSYTLGGIYFYLVNCFFIGLATFLLARFSGIHKRINKIEIQSNSNKWLWMFIVILMTLPGLYLAYYKFIDEKAKRSFKSDEERITELELKVKKLDSLSTVR